MSCVHAYEHICIRLTYLHLYTDLFGILLARLNQMSIIKADFYGQQIPWWINSFEYCIIIRWLDIYNCVINEIMLIYLCIQFICTCQCSYLPILVTNACSQTEIRNSEHECFWCIMHVATRENLDVAIMASGITFLHIEIIKGKIQKNICTD